MTSDNRIKLAGLWGEIQAAVRDRVSTADLWTRANEAAQSRGFTGVTGSALEMGALRSIAAKLRNSAETFARAAPGQALDPTMFAPNLNAQSTTNREITPTYRVRYLQQVRTAEGDIVGAFRTTSFPVQLPSTKEALLAELQADASLLAEKYGEQHVDLGEVEISVV